MPASRMAGRIAARKAPCWGGQSSGLNAAAILLVGVWRESELSHPNRDKEWPALVNCKVGFPNYGNREREMARSNSLTTTTVKQQWSAFPRGFSECHDRTIWKSFGFVMPPAPALLYHQFLGAQSPQIHSQALFHSLCTCKYDLVPPTSPRYREGIKR